IQESIDSPLTESGDSCFVCPGEYPEQVTLNKSINLISIEGAENTTINGGNSWALKAGAGGAVNGFTIVGSDNAIQGFRSIDFKLLNNRTLVDKIFFYESLNPEFSNNKFYNLTALTFAITHNGKILNNQAIAGEAEIRLEGASDNEIIGNSNFQVIISKFPLSNERSQSNFVSSNTLRDIYIYDSPFNKIISNTISGSNTSGVMIMGTIHSTALSNTIEQNDISSCAVNGIMLEDARSTVIHDNKIYDNGASGLFIGSGSKVTKVYKNIINNNEWHGIVTERAESNTIFENTVSNHQTDDKIGIYVVDSQNTRVYSNRIWRNCTGIKVYNSPSTFIGLNNVIDAFCLFTGISLDHASPEIFGNNIINNTGNGIFAENGSNPVIRSNNIFGNTDYGVNNVDGTVQIDAQNNWWGDASGAGMTGISGNVDFSGWRTSPVALVAIAGTDTAFVPIGQADSVLCSLQNWENLEDIVQLTIEADSAGWVTGATGFTLELQDSLGANVFIGVQVPQHANSGASSLVKMTAVSQSDPTKTDVDSFYVVAYRRYLAKIMVNPDAVVLRAGQSQQFNASGYDSVGLLMDIAVSWSATGEGAIDSSGLYIAGSDTGRFLVTARDPVSQRSASATVRVFPMLASIELSPDFVVLEPHETARFLVQGYDSLGAPVTVLPIWSANGGTIDQAGLYTAGSDSGFFMVTVMDSLAALADTATVHITTITKVAESHKSELPEKFFLRQSYPNPFNPVAAIEYGVKEPCHVVLKVFDIRGREVMTLIDIHHQSGFYKVNFDAKNLSTGVYFYRIRMKDFVAVRKMVLLE
ncbi:MAG: right-handed parallel beta-helix repeat-containing protein, partial [bacterium]|nr:right-handed parallel beta-helix repeat-containing protein [bacterium]